MYTVGKRTFFPVNLQTKLNLVPAALLIGRHNAVSGSNPSNDVSASDIIFVFFRVRALKIK
jgi:hypothetical protein